MRSRSHQEGFTLLELLIVIAVLGILTAILIPNFVRSRAASLLATCQLDLRNTSAALDLYYNENQVYPDPSGWQTTLESGGYIRKVPASPVDKAPYGYATDAARSTFVLSDGPNKYTQVGVYGYVVYTATGGLQVGVASVPTP